MDMIGVGEILIDFIPGSEPFSYIRKAGGAPMNATVAVARNGLEAGFYGKVGNDDFGTFLLETLKENNVKPLSPAPTREAVTTMAIVTLYEDGERTFTFVRKPGADMMLSPEDIKEEDIENTRLVHGGSLTLSGGPVTDATVKVLRVAHEKGKLVSFDVNYRDFIWDGDEKAAVEKVRGILPYVDLLKVSDEEVGLFGGPEKIPELMKEYGISAVIETLGADGAQCFFQDTCFKVPGRKAKAVDATGAGDAFWGGFLSSILIQGVNSSSDLSREKLTNAMNYGNVAGWFTVQKKGAIEALPTRQEIEEQL